MELAISSWGLRNEVNNDYPLSQMALKTKERVGIADVELCQQHFARQDARYLDELIKGLEAAGGRCINMPVDTGNLGNPDLKARRHDLRVIEGWIAVAQYIGCPSIRVNTGHADDEGALERVAEGYIHLAEVGRRVGVSILLENHGGLSADFNNVMQLIERVGRDNLALCPDFGNFPEEERYDAIKEMLPYSSIVHAKYNQPGAGGAEFDFARCAQVVKESTFDGPVSIEIGRHTDPWESIRTALKLWNE